MNPINWPNWYEGMTPHTGYNSSHERPYLFLCSSQAYIRDRDQIEEIKHSDLLDSTIYVTLLNQSSLPTSANGPQD